MAKVELHAAYFWICDHCASDNYARAVTTHIDMDALLAPENRLDSHLVGVEPPEGADGPEELTQRVVLYPPTVQCQTCGRTYEAAIPNEEDDVDA